MPNPSDKPLPDAERLLAKSTDDVAAALRRMIEATVDRWTKGFTEAGFDATEALAQVLSGRLTESAMLGARTLLQAYDAALKSRGIPIPEVAHGFSVAPVAPTHAVRAMIAKEPRLAQTSQEVARLYSKGNVFAVAKSADLVVTEKVRGAITAALESGAPTEVATQVVADLGGWSKSYAETVVKTNIGRAYSEGQDLKAKEPGVRDIVVGYVYDGPNDVNTRPNHRALIGWRASVDDERWKIVGPPSGFSCRHVRRLLTVFEAKRLGWLGPDGRLVAVPIPAGGGPDPGFNPGA